MNKYICSDNNKIYFAIVLNIQLFVSSIQVCSRCGNDKKTASTLDRKQSDRDRTIVVEKAKR